MKESTIYVSLEPCSHFRKTPPCAALIASKGIRRGVVAVKDPNEDVAGRGIMMLKEAGAEVIVGILEEKAKELNRSFFVNQTEKRSFVTLKWAQTKDGFIDNERDNREMPPLKLSNSITQSIVHKLRSQNMGVMVGTNTALKDNPTLNARHWYGSNPVRIVLDRTGKLSVDSNLFNDCAQTVVFTGLDNYPVIDNVTVIQIDFQEDIVEQVLHKLYENDIATLMIEGGSMLISSFVEKGLWDEAFVEVANFEIGCGIRAPLVSGSTINAKKYIDSLHYHIKKRITRN